ncbi:HAD-IIB family hydrolase [Salinispirillum sp. LH 10-3-1]|uniref:HAD-IIB family hydrolase n=1 Tax=Salinispirillum sp. LH 10-3-1 TaxID=2952525 RepID=A0AB38YFX0_9GAMM
MSVQDVNLAAVRFLFTDVDDTLTTAGQLLPETYAALWALARSGVQIVPITGGCAGWCDQIARTWPVAGVIGEGGAFYVRRDASHHLHWQYWRSAAEHQADQQAILASIQQLPVSYPLVLAKDQSFRHVDVAIDYNQDSQLTIEQADEVCALLRQEGFNAKRSSIHINVWRGDFNKCAMAQRMLRDVFKLSSAEMQAQVCFIGDAPNDESMFEFFPISVGVANIKPHLTTMQHHPAVITQAPSGLGVVELAQHWLAQRP